MSVYIYPGNAVTGEVGEPLGPFEHVVMTYDLLRAAPEGGDGDALTIGHLSGEVHMYEGDVAMNVWEVGEYEWTDLTISTEAPR